jgi:hypothetical protein
MDDMGVHILLANVQMHRQSSPRAGDGVASVAKI